MKSLPSLKMAEEYEDNIKDSAEPIEAEDEEELEDIESTPEDKEMVEISSDSATGDITFIFHIGDKESSPQDRAGAVSVLDSVEAFGTDDEPVNADTLLDEAEDVGSVEFWVTPEDREKIDGWMV